MLPCSSLLPLMYSISGYHVKFIEIFKESRPTVLVWDCCYKQPFHFIAGSVSGVQRSRTQIHFRLPHSQPSHPNNWIVLHSRDLEGTRLILEVERSSSVIPSKSSHPVPNRTSMLKSPTLVIRCIRLWVSRHLHHEKLYLAWLGLPPTLSRFQSPGPTPTHIY